MAEFSSAVYSHQRKTVWIEQLNVQNSNLRTTLNYSEEFYSSQIDDLGIQNVAIPEELNTIFSEDQNFEGGSVLKTTIFI